MTLALPVIEMVFAALLAHFKAGGKTDHPVVVQGLQVVNAALQSIGSPTNTAKQ